MPWAIVADARLALAVLAAAFYRDPSREMQVIGITGTNGKTTTAYLLASIFEAAGIRCGILGTVAYRIGDEQSRSDAHDARSAGRAGAAARDGRRGCGACAMEVSSHALSLHRVDGITFAAGVFTNLTRDHLDFHADMDDYFRAKRRLFEMLPRDAPSLLNLDDPRGASLVDAGGRAGHLRDQPRRRHHARDRCRSRSTGLTFDVRTPRGTVHVQSTLVGRPNVYNILAAVATATALDVPFDAIERGRRSARRRARTLPGRLRRRTTKSRSSSTTRTPTMRCAICSRPRGRSRAAG